MRFPGRNGTAVVTLPRTVTLTPPGMDDHSIPLIAQSSPTPRHGTEGSGRVALNSGMDSSGSFGARQKFGIRSLARSSRPS